MKPIGFMNGWKEAPHCWKTFLLRPVRVDRAPGSWISLSVVGLVWFFNDFMENA
jgi:hypothetical protein